MSGQAQHQWNYLLHFQTMENYLVYYQFLKEKYNQKMFSKKIPYTSPLLNLALSITSSSDFFYFKSGERTWWLCITPQRLQKVQRQCKKRTRKFQKAQLDSGPNIHSNMMAKISIKAHGKLKNSPCSMKSSPTIEKAIPALRQQD